MTEKRELKEHALKALGDSRPNTRLEKNDQDLSSRLFPGRHRRNRVGGRRHIDGLEIGRTDDFEIFHIR